MSDARGRPAEPRRAPPAPGPLVPALHALQVAWAQAGPSQGGAGSPAFDAAAAGFAEAGLAAAVSLATLLAILDALATPRRDRFGRPTADWRRVRAGRVAIGHYAGDV